MYLNSGASVRNEALPGHESSRAVPREAVSTPSVLIVFVIDDNHAKHRQKAQPSMQRYRTKRKTQNFKGVNEQRRKRAKNEMRSARLGDSVHCYSKSASGQSR